MKDQENGGPTQRSIGQATFFAQTNMARVCFVRILGRFWFRTLESKCCICLATSLKTVQHRPTMMDSLSPLDDVEIVWPGL